MKKVLSFIDWYWPGYKAGGTTKAFRNMVSALNHDVCFYIVTRNTDYTSSKSYEGYKYDTWNEIEKNVYVYYASEKATNLRSWRKIIREIQYDTLYIHGVYSFWYSLLPLYLGKRLKKSKIVMASHGMLGSHALAVKRPKNGSFYASDNEEAKEILSNAGKSRIIEIAGELPASNFKQASNSIHKPSGSLRMIWLGRIAPEKNLLFALQILKTVVSGRITYDIYGPIYDEAYWEQCKTEINSLSSNIRVNYKGSVPGDRVTEILKNYHLLFLPTTGENFGHSILESLGAGRPVLISDQTPWRGLRQARAGFDLSLNDRNAFENAINEMLHIPDSEYQKYCKGTAAYLDNTFDIESNILTNLELLSASA